MSPYVMGHFCLLVEHAMVAYSTVLVPEFGALRLQEARAIGSTLDISFLRPMLVCTFNQTLSHA